MNRVAAPGRAFVAGDLNGFFGLLVDNLSILGFLVATLVGVFGFPAEFVYTKMVPGTALGVLAGNLLYTRMAATLARRSGRDDVTAMPLGLDAPTTIGLALLVLGPAYAALRARGVPVEDAALRTWQLGMAAMVAMGALKLVLSFFGDAVQRAIPRAGLLGSIAGIALMLMGLLPLVEAMRTPIVGFVTLGLLLYALIARGAVPFRMPGVLFALLVGLALYAALVVAKVAPAPVTTVAPLQLAVPWPSLGFLAGLDALLPYLSLVLPFGLLMVVGGINVAESARAAGDDYRTRDVLLVEAFATLLAGICGGVAQTTPYIGQPAYKRMGARRGYTLLTGLVVGLGGVLGYLAAFVAWLPLAVLAPIIVYVAIDITVQAFDATPRAHAPAVVLSFLPAIAYLVAIKLGNPAYVPPEAHARLLAESTHGWSELALIVALGNGFIITAMLWAAWLVALIEGRPRLAAMWLLLGSALAAFGLIHSVVPSGAIYLPWTLEPGSLRLVAELCGAYAALAALLMLLSLQRPPARAP